MDISEEPDPRDPNHPWETKSYPLFLYFLVWVSFRIASECLQRVIHAHKHAHAKCNQDTPSQNKDGRRSQALSLSSDNRQWQKIRTLFLLEPSPHSRMKERSLKYKPSCNYVGHTLKQSDMTACTLFCLVTSTQKHVLVEWGSAAIEWAQMEAGVGTDAARLQI